MARYSIEPERRTLHGSFSPEYPPVMTIESGDTVEYRTLDAGWSIEPRTSLQWEEQPRKFEPRDPERDAGHALCGPIAIRGAKPGMTLEVSIDVIRPAGWGWSGAGGWDSSVNRELGVTEAGVLHLWRLDPEGLTGTNQQGHSVKLRPFMGVMGMPPNESGIHSTAPPRITGGNIDCKELIAGSRLFLPVAVAGGLFSVGDGHAVQGDGEVSTLAIECPMDQVELTFRLHDTAPLTTPRAKTAEGWLTLGFHEDLNRATITALDAMLLLMQEQYSLTRLDALALASLTVDLRITQIVNGVRGVHAVLPHDALKTA